MILGMALSTYTTTHVVLSLVGILTGFIVTFGMFAAKRMNGMTALFLVTTLLTSVGGFGFPNEHITPGIIIGIISVVVLLIAILARYALHLLGAWRGIYAASAVFAFYLNFFVLIAQGFKKIPTLHPLAPTQKEPPFFIVQTIALVLFIVFGVYAVKRFHPGSERAA